MRHVHAELMKLYAEDAMETDRPWKRWQFCPPGRSWTSHSCTNPMWEEDYQYRRKPKIVTVNGFEVVDDVIMEAPEEDTEYWFECQVSNGFVDRYSWDHDPLDLMLLERGLTHTTKEGAIAHCKARLGIDPNE